MIGKLHRSPSFGDTLKYVSRGDRLTPLMDNLGCTKLHEPHSDGMAQEMEAMAMGSRSQRPCLHVSLSPEKGDHLSDVQWGEAAVLYMEGMGLDNHQFALYLHHDEDYGPGTQERPHAHIVANLVGDDGRQADISWNYFHSQRTIRDIEQGLGLEHRPSWWEVARDKAIAKESQQYDPQPGQPTTLGRDQEFHSSPREPGPRAIPDSERRGATQAPGRDRQVEPHRSREFQQATTRSSQGESLDISGDRSTAERDHHLGNSSVVPNLQSQTDSESRDSPATHREASGHSIQQQRVEAIAPQLRSLILKHGTPCQGGALLEGETHTMVWHQETARLAIFENGVDSPVMVAQRDTQNQSQWHDLGSTLTEEQVDYFKESEGRINAFLNQQRQLEIQQRQRQRQQRRQQERER